MRSWLPISNFGGLTMSSIFETLFGLQFCQYKCGTYIGFSDDEKSSDGQSHKPLEASTGKIHNCPKRGWSDSVSCFKCGKQVIFHNSHINPSTEKKYRFDSPGVKHSCTQQSQDYEHNTQDDYQPNEKQRQQEQYQEPQDYEKIWEQYEKQQQEHRQRQQEQHQRQQEQHQRQQRQEQQFRKIYDEKVIKAYAFFNLNHNSTLEQIKSTYRKFALKYHPDKNKSNDSTVKMTEINDAYEEITRWKENHD